MKNIYNLNATRIESENFELDVFIVPKFWFCEIMYQQQLGYDAEKSNM